MINSEQLKINKIKHLQRYQKKLLNANSEELLILINKLYKYLFKKSFIDVKDFIKVQINSQLTTIINSTRYNYSPMNAETLKHLAFDFCVQKYSKTPQLMYHTAKVNSIDNNAFDTTLKEMNNLNKSPLKRYNFNDYKQHKN